MHKIEIQGHRGCRGDLPENTLIGFAHTLATGVDAIEFDIGLSADEQAVIVHDRRLSRDIFRSADGRWLDAPEPTVWSLTLEQLRAFDAGRLRPGSDYAARFPGQRPVDGVGIPTLVEYIQLLEDMDCRHVGLNIEVKLSPEAKSETAEPEVFVQQLLDILDNAGLNEQSVIQSFDWRIPLLVKRYNPAIRTSCLSVEGDDEDTIRRHIGESPWTGGLAIRDTDGSVPALVARIGADVWSPWYGDIDAAQLAEAKALDLRVITWTVNEREDMLRMIDFGVDGIISDYPKRLRDVFVECGRPVPDGRPGAVPGGIQQLLESSQQTTGY